MNKFKNKVMDLHFHGIDISGIPIVLGIAILLIMFLIYPIIAFIVGYFFGWITKLIIGKYIIEAFALIGIVISIDKIPLIAGLIAWISIFLPHPTNNNNNN